MIGTNHKIVGMNIGQQCRLKAQRESGLNKSLQTGAMKARALKSEIENQNQNQALMTISSVNNVTPTLPASSAAENADPIEPIEWTWTKAAAAIGLHPYWFALYNGIQCERAKDYNQNLSPKMIESLKVPSAEAIYALWMKHTRPHDSDKPLPPLTLAELDVDFDEGHPIVVTDYRALSEEEALIVITARMIYYSHLQDNFDSLNVRSGNIAFRKPYQKTWKGPHRQTASGTDGWSKCNVFVGEVLSTRYRYPWMFPHYHYPDPENIIQQTVRDGFADLIWQGTFKASSVARDSLRFPKTGPIPIYKHGDRRDLFHKMPKRFVRGEDLKVNAIPAEFASDSNVWFCRVDDVDLLKAGMCYDGLVESEHGTGFFQTKAGDAVRNVRPGDFVVLHLEAQGPDHSGIVTGVELKEDGKMRIRVIDYDGEMYLEYSDVEDVAAFMRMRKSARHQNPRKPVYFQYTQPQLYLDEDGDDIYHIEEPDQAREHIKSSLARIDDAVQALNDYLEQESSMKSGRLQWTLERSLEDATTESAPASVRNYAPYLFEVEPEGVRKDALKRFETFHQLLASISFNPKYKFRKGVYPYFLKFDAQLGTVFFKDYELYLRGDQRLD